MPKENGDGELGGRKEIRERGRESSAPARQRMKRSVLLTRRSSNTSGTLSWEGHKGVLDVEDLSRDLE